MNSFFKTTMILSAAASTLVAAPASAKSTENFYNQYGWSVGDTSKSEDVEGLSVSFNIQSSYERGKIYAVAEFCNNSTTDWSGYARVSDTYPNTTQFSLRVPAGRCSRWGEHFDATTMLYVLVDQGS